MVADWPSYNEALVEQAETHCRVIKALCDGDYESRYNFTFLEERGIEPAIKVRRNSSRRARGCPARKRVVMEYLRDPKEWKRRVGYGLRWMAETAFSTFKRYSANTSGLEASPT